MMPRIALARFLLRLSQFLSTLPVVIMRPGDMVEFSRQAYERNSRAYGELNDPDAGLSQDEMVLWEKVPCQSGRMLVLGGGGGREVIFFARQGFAVTGVDFSDQTKRGGAVLQTKQKEPTTPPDISSLEVQGLARSTSQRSQRSEGP